MTKFLILSVLALAAEAIRNPNAHLKQHLLASIGGDSKEHKLNYAALGRMRLQNARVVPSKRAMTSSGEALNTYYYIDGEVVLYVSNPLDVCICGETYGGDSLCELRTATQNADGSVTSTLYEYITAQQCDGAVYDETTRTTEYPINFPMTFSCDDDDNEGEDEGEDLITFQIYGRVESGTAYESLGTGVVETEYATYSDCENDIALELTFRYFFECGKGVYGIYPANCTVTFTESSSSSTSGTRTYYTDDTCATATVEETHTRVSKCLATDDDEDDDDEVRVTYESWFIQGSSGSGSSSASDVTISETEYNGLVSGVVIACVVAAALLAVLFYYFVFSKKAMGGASNSSGL